MALERHEDTERVVEILEATCRVIARDGWHGLRMDGVAREAGVSKALVHYYFSTRQELLRAAFQQSEDRANARVEAELGLAGTPAERLERFVLLDFEEEPVFKENRALWSEVWSGMRLDAALRPDVDRAYRGWVARLVELVEEGWEGRSAPSSAEDAAWRLAALVDGVDSLLLLGLITQEKARALIRESIATALRGVPGLGPEPNSRALASVSTVETTREKGDAR